MDFHPLLGYGRHRKENLTDEKTRKNSISPQHTIITFMAMQVHSVKPLKG